MKRSLGGAVLLALGVLSACSGSGQDELQKWMAEQQSMARPKVQPIAEPKKFVPQTYLHEGKTEPFSSLKLTQALRRESNQATSNAQLIAPELARRKEPLEAYPLDALRMVGSLIKKGQPVALVMMDKLLYQVKVGNYLGSNYGRITHITDTEVVLREIVQDAAGEWVERKATLQLQEKTQ